ncbi:PfkB-like carbohydrate kinase family protein isoform 2 [Hibiscus syriacus]|uniref:PfkB-like carbohydrate kinase family protein isoform 2 n=1 Tax=Hibiscus syriacus TaxID=106335 RepID=A0A6A3CYS6_HIBSY|nr:PfkB-like carbohydrate kinase family protein isoform 2 [Hibiscus syriacus]
MGAETLVKNGEAKAPLILGQQPAALIDHVARVDWSLLNQIPGERGGSIPVEIKELEHILSSGFGINSGMIGAYGDDEQGQLFWVCLVDAYSNRAMRPCLSTAVKVQGDELTKDDFSGSKVTKEPCSLGFSFS